MLQMEHFKIYETLDSTNKEAARLLASGQFLHESVIFTHHQTQGRGQYGRSWFSEPGNHLAISIVLQPGQMLPEELPVLSMKVSLAIVRTLFALEPTLQPKIKWPNDIYINNKKIAGILIENSISNTKVHYCIIGIGMNVNESHFPKDLPNPVSLTLLTGKKYPIIPIAEMVREQLINILNEATEKWKPEYDQSIYGLGKKHEFQQNGKKLISKVLGIDMDGKIRLVAIDGESKSYFSHEINWLK